MVRPVNAYFTNHKSNKMKQIHTIYYGIEIVVARPRTEYFAFINGQLHSSVYLPHLKKQIRKKVSK